MTRRKPVIKSLKTMKIAYTTAKRNSKVKVKIKLTLIACKMTNFHSMTTWTKIEEISDSKSLRVVKILYQKHTHSTVQLSTELIIARWVKLATSTAWEFVLTMKRMEMEVRSIKWQVATHTNIQLRKRILSLKLQRGTQCFSLSITNTHSHDQMSQATIS